MRGVRTAGLCSQRTKRLGHQGAKTREEHPERELTNVGARCDTPALDLRCAPRMWRNRDLQKSLFLAHGPAEFSSSSYPKTRQNRERIHFANREWQRKLLQGYGHLIVACYTAYGDLNWDRGVFRHTLRDLNVDLIKSNEARCTAGE